MCPFDSITFTAVGLRASPRTHTRVRHRVSYISRLGTYVEVLTTSLNRARICVRQHVQRSQFPLSACARAAATPERPDGIRPSEKDIHCVRHSLLPQHHQNWGEEAISTPGHVQPVLYG